MSNNFAEFVAEQPEEEHYQAPHNSGFGSIAPYDEPIVAIKDFTDYIFADLPGKAKNYVVSLFPIAQWIYRYNLVWLSGDLIAGLTVGAVVVPQGMSYAKIATLPPQYGLYSSFVGVLIYCFFATSKDVSIGPVAVMSLQISKVIATVIKHHPEFTNDPVQIAVAMSLLCGSIALGIGLLRFGFILEFIPMPAVLGFMSGSAFTIAMGQVPGLFGISTLFNTRAATHLVVIHTLQNLKHTTLDAAFGLVPLFLLYFSRWGFDYLGKRYPRYQRVFFFASVLRNAVIIIFCTLIAWIVCRHKTPKEFPISILKTVPRGLQDVGSHLPTKKLVSALATELPISTVILLMEHIAIAKSFGRVNDYRINPNQELVAIGVTNLIGTLFNAYPATGSFSRSALKSKCGVRTPLAGIFTGIVVLVAIYALTGTFYYIPNATLSAVIIHAVTDLITPWHVTWRFWKTSPVDTVIFIGAVFLSVFVTLESGIYFSFAACFVYMLARMAFPTADFLGRVEITQIENPQLAETVEEVSDGKVSPSDSVKSTEKKSAYKYRVGEVSGAAPRVLPRKYKWVPLSHRKINKDVEVLPPPPGVIVFRPNESFTYPNCSRQLGKLIDIVRRDTRPGIDRVKNVKLGDRPWNDHGPRKRVYDADYVDSRPLLRAIIYDFSATPHVDLTGVQALADIRQEVNKYADREVEYHFVGILSPWTRRALMADSFGGNNSATRPERHYVELAVRRAAGDLSAEDDSDVKRKGKYRDEEERDTSSAIVEGEYVPIVGTNTPFFHLDIPDLDISHLEP